MTMGAALETTVIHRRPLAAVTLRSTAKSDSSRSLEHEDSKPVGAGLSRRLQVKLESGRIGNLSWPDNIDERAAAGCTEKIPVTVPVLCNLGGSRRVRGGFKVGISPPGSRPVPGRFPAMSAAWRTPVDIRRRLRHSPQPRCR